MLLALLSRVADPVEERANVLLSYNAYVSCLKLATVRAGAFNEVAPRVVVDSAAAKCKDDLRSFIESFYANAPHSERHDAQLRNFALRATDEAEAELIVVRAGSKGTNEIRPSKR